MVLAIFAPQWITTKAGAWVLGIVGLIFIITLLTLTAIASFAGGTIGAVLLMVFAPMLSTVALLFHSAEYFALMVVGWVNPSWAGPGWLDVLFPLVMLSYPLAIFIAILLVGLVYVWNKGDLDWVKKLVERTDGPTADPALEEEVSSP